LAVYSVDSSEIGILQLLPSRGFFVSDLPTLALHGVNCDSASNYHLMDKEATRGMVILLKIISSMLITIWDIPILCYLYSIAII
jgi:hypothetical protein